jgi:hypothetical protein
MQLIRRLESGVFQYLVNRAAFLDQVVLSVRSKCCLNGDALVGAVNSGILTSHGLYARCLRGNWHVTGNPIQILYGKTSPFERVPNARITLRSEIVPWTWAQAQLSIAELLNAPNVPLEVSLAELTFDSDRLSFEEFDRRMVYRARTSKQLKDDWGRRTIYVGSLRSQWQGRIYQKTDKIIRLEFVLRRDFLRKIGIRSPHTLALLRQLPLSRLLSLRSFAATRLWDATTHWPNSTVRRRLREWGQDGGCLRVLAWLLRDNGVDPRRVLIDSQRQLVYSEMAQNLIW